MSKVLCESQDLTNIADAIREKTNTTDTMAVSSMAYNINSISNNGISDEYIAQIEQNTSNINQLQQEIADLGGGGLPSYYNEYLAEKIETIIALQEDAGANASVFIFFSDSHDVSTQYATLIANKIMEDCNINHLFFGGDAEKYSASSEDDAKESLQRMLVHLKKGKNIAVTRGNHDGAFGASDENFIDKNKLYANYNIINQCKADDYGAENTYCYIDDKAERTRYIVLDTWDYPNITERPADVFMGLRQEQYDWLINALNVESGWHVVVITHIPPIPAYYNDGNGALIPSRTPLKHLAYLLGAFDDKTTYSATFAGAQGSTLTGGYTNLFSTEGEGFTNDNDFSNSGTVGRFLTNQIMFDKIDSPVFHIKGATPYKMKVYQYIENENYYAWTQALYCTNASTPISTSDYDSEVKVVSHTSGYPIAGVQFEFREGSPDDIVITVNEDIIESSGSASWDSLEINADFTSYQGEFIGLFAGHLHQDYRYLKSDGFGCDITTICCDARGLDERSYNQDENFEYRAEGTVYEQALDVVIVNKRTKKVNCVRIGAGYDREFTC